MSREHELESYLLTRGVPIHQVRGLVNHINCAENFVYYPDPGPEAALEWLHESMFSAMDKDSAKVLFSILLANQPKPDVKYTEKGYDSCQSHRNIAKVIG